MDNVHQEKNVLTRLIWDITPTLAEGSQRDDNPEADTSGGFLPHGRLDVLNRGFQF
jgi:hypothetical protein